MDVSVAICKLLTCERHVGTGNVDNNYAIDVKNKGQALVDHAPTKLFSKICGRFQCD